MYKRLRGFCVIFSFLFISGFCYAKDKILIEEFESYQKKKNKSVDMTKLYLKSISKLKVKKALAKIKSECKWNNNLVNKYDWEIIEFGDYKTPVDDDEIINLELIKRAHDYWISTLKDDDLLENLGILDDEDDEDDEEEDEEDFELESNKSYPIKWIVLEKNDEDMLLCSLYPIDWRTFSGSFKTYKEFTKENYETKKVGKTSISKPKFIGEKQIVTWETSDLRKWLNNDFYNTAFSDEEKSRIKTCSVKNNPNPKYGTYCGKDTLDKVFLLSVEELFKYFPKFEMQQLPSKLKDIYVKRNYNRYIINYYKSGGVLHLENLSSSQTSHPDFEEMLDLTVTNGNWGNKPNEYWLRTMGGGNTISSTPNNVVTINYLGQAGSKPENPDFWVCYYGTYYVNKCAVRPVIRVKILK